MKECSEVANYKSYTEKFKLELHKNINHFKIH